MSGESDRATVITVRGVSFSYSGVRVLDEVNLDIYENDFAAVVGPNGGGKTTLLKLMLGLLRPDRGEIRVLDEPPGKSRPRVGYVPQNSQCDMQFPVTVMDVVLMGRLDLSRRFGWYRRPDRQIAGRALADVNMFDLRKRPIGSLSGGQRQRTLIARALAVEPRLLMLDEPMANLDIEREKELYSLLNELAKKLTIVMVTHDLGFVPGHVNRVICVNRKVVIHPTSDVDGADFSKMYDMDVRIVRHDHSLRGGDLACPGS